jgi:DNA-binding GntR family transcriptional regulator
MAAGRRLFACLDTAMTLQDVGKTEPVVRPVLAVELTDRIRRMIVEGDLKGGEKVPERELTLRFGVSRTPVREALKVLAAEGFVRLLPNRGAVVSRQTAEELAEIFPIIAALESVAGELAAERASDADIATVARLTGQLSVTFEAGDRPRYFDINQAIHKAILAAAGNRTLAQQHAALAGRIYRARYAANLENKRWLAAIGEHEAIAAALEARDGRRLGRLMKEHFENKLKSLLSGGEI